MILHVRRVFLLLLLIGTSCSTLVPPYDEGVVIKISEDLLQNIAHEVVDKAADDLKALTLSDSLKDGKLTINYWDLTFPRLTMTPHINVEKKEGGEKLVLEGKVTGDITADSRWRVTRKSWYGSISFSGGVDVKMSGFSVKTRVILGKISDDGYLGFQHDPNYCEFDAGSLHMHFTGKTGWIINLFMGIFKPEIRKLLEQYVCLTINDEVDKTATKLNTAVFDRYDEIEVMGHRIEINNRPWIVTGGDNCAVIGAMGQITLPDSDTTAEITEPFIDPTGNPDVEFYTSYSSTSSSSSSPTTQYQHIPRHKRDGVDLCAVLPGSGTEVAVIVTEDIISRIARSLHYLNLVNYKAVQESGTTQLFEQFWGGEPAGRVRIPTSNNGLLRDYQVTFKITSTAPPNVTLSEVGVVVQSPLRARVTLVKQGLEVRLELRTVITFLGRCNLAQIDGVYRLVPAVTSGADVTRGRIQVGGLPGGAELSEGMVQEIEDQLNMILGIGLPALVKKELKNGFPLNIPSQHILIEEAKIEYRRGYILISADNVEVSL